MIDVLRQKAKTLMRGDEGVALVVTLALFMFLYVSCAGVFAVGRAVKERVLLQNAADAAAYSAAVVQADTLSRIAVINRAMAWTYKDMIQRQHDYVLLTWLEVAFAAYMSDSAAYGGRVYADSAGTVQGRINLNGKYVPITEVADALKRLDDIKGGISADAARLKEMNDEILELIENLVGGGTSAETGTARAVVRRILEANLSGEYGKQCLRKFVANEGWWEIGNDEDAFLNLDPDVQEVESDVDDPWFPVSESEDGICRYYLRGADKNVASWTYRTTVYSPPTPHVPDIESRTVLERPLVADNGSDEDYMAKPIVLRKEYFLTDGGRGAMSVCVAHRTDNPWKFGGTALDGFYDAFKPFSEHSRWARAVSSAQAGYRGGAEEGSYSVRWKDGGNWNLGTNDWDAVYVPVRKAFSPDAFKEMIESDSGWEKVLETGYDNLTSSYSDGVNGATHLPRMHNNSGSENKLNWGADGAYRFLDLLFH